MNPKMYSVERLTREEYEMAMKAVQEVRKEKARLEMIKQATEILDAGVLMMIELVGLEQTKAILREKNRELRQ